MNTLINPIHLVGITLDHKTTNEGGQSAINCGGLWTKFQKEGVLAGINGRLNDTIYPVYFDYEGDYMMPFSYFIG